MSCKYHATFRCNDTRRDDGGDGDDGDGEGTLLGEITGMQAMYCTAWMDVNIFYADTKKQPPFASPSQLDCPHLSLT